jgi:hypothetical protein
MHVPVVCGIVDACVCECIYMYKLSEAFLLLLARLLAASAYSRLYATHNLKEAGQGAAPATAVVDMRPVPALPLPVPVSLPPSPSTPPERGPSPPPLQRRSNNSRLSLLV